MTMRNWLLALALVILTAPHMRAVTTAATMGPPPMVIQNAGFQTPESVLHHVRADVYLVSNINGNPTGVDNNGFISKISPAGKVTALKWISGGAGGVTLNAPKGMALARDTLYVSDITVVRMFDGTSGKAKGQIDFPGSTFLNDVAAGPDGSVYVTDSGLKPDFSASGTDAVYKIDASGKVSTVAKSTDLNHPNGVAVMPNGRLVIVNFSDKGEMYSIGADGKKTGVRLLPAAQLDGVVLLADGSALVSSWQAKAVYRVDARGMAKVVVENVEAPADIGYDRRRGRVLIPLFTQNKVVMQAVK